MLDRLLYLKPDLQKCVINHMLLTYIYILQNLIMLMQLHCHF